ncbi:hypothetical protein [Legionella oakridgensis]|uniref:Uncharacterized protein n=2 Tax=Legionella oakridgensis TaxID=29423 RepID=W0BE24_9GAMM|nr:hypothetical protein [Legionella oakridgensis]AHE66867.1 hypothetical protein Loa_01314 [Legionella oakridgensis ATCC 33761 = DSM 21215]ETO93440.1 hypothetical protein LOR_46c07770 [Legionella oakridgensis RV-2-2007]KTD39758.1 hypothetical protein Loak_0865 [Legionella oakridgensis]STY19978.1 Uncharacterised protein [Legionella longbeachae]
MTFFKRIPDEEWGKSCRKEAEAYDRKDRKHVLAQETTLTAEALQKIALAKRKGKEAQQPELPESPEQPESTEPPRPA